jgi:hypothetical protein
MRELDLISVMADAVQAEVIAAAAALREWSSHPPTPLLLGLCDGLQAKMAEMKTPNIER